jgi:glycogen synthase
VRARGMAQRFGWGAAAQGYRALYRAALAAVSA